MRVLSVAGLLIVLVLLVACGSAATPSSEPASKDVAPEAAPTADGPSSAGVAPSTKAGETPEKSAVKSTDNVVGASGGAGGRASANGAPTDFSQLDQLDFTQPLIIMGLASGEFRVLRLSEDATHTHIAGMNQVFEQLCPLMADHRITTLATNRVIYGSDGKGIERSLEQGLLALGQAAQSGDMESMMQSITAPANRMEIDVSNARKDALLLIYTYKCDSQLVTTFYSNMGKFVESPFATTATVPLHESEVRDLYWGALRSRSSVPANKRQLVNRQVQQLMSSGQQVIQCTYGPSDPVKGVGFQTWEFWYQKVPGNIIEMLESVPSGTHPMRTLGLNSINECPESPELAEKVKRAGAIP